MVLQAMTFETKRDDDGSPQQVPATVTVTMTLAEAAAVAVVFGKCSEVAGRALGDEDIPERIYTCLTRDVFNPYWDGGIEDVLVVDVEWDAINGRDTRVSPGWREEGS